MPTGKGSTGTCTGTFTRTFTGTNTGAFTGTNRLGILTLIPFHIGAARLLGLFAANYSLGVFLSLCESSTSCSFLGTGLVCCKTGGGAGCFRFVGGARTIILSIKLRWRNRVDLNRDHMQI